MAQSDAFLQEEGKGEAWLYAGGGSTKTIYDADGRQRLFDTSGTRFSAYVFGLNVDYGLTDRLELNLSLPVGLFSLTSDVHFPDRSILAPAYLGLGATYGVTTGDLLSAIALQVRVPPGFHRGIYNDPNHPSFLSDGFLEVRGQIAGAYAGDGFWVKGSGAYSWRDEEPEDQIVLEAQAGLSRVEGTGVFVSAEWLLSLGDASNPARPFYAGSQGDFSEFTGGVGRMTTIAEEEYLVIAPGAYFDFLDDWTISTQYRLRLAGTHTIRLNSLFVGLGYRF